MRCLVTAMEKEAEELQAAGESTLTRLRLC